MGKREREREKSRLAYSYAVFVPDPALISPRPTQTTRERVRPFSKEWHQFTRARRGALLFVVVVHRARRCNVLVLISSASPKKHRRRFTVAKNAVVSRRIVT